MDIQMPAVKFYATFEEILTEIAVFNTEEERSEWVNFCDWFSIATNTTADNSTLHRIALSNAEANAIAGDMLHLPELFTEDPILNNVEWLIIF